nr:unnamed protein product [Spirometra erinaceieuropaei]
MGNAPLLGTDGSTLLTEKSQILKRLTDHFRNVHNFFRNLRRRHRPTEVKINVDLDLPPSLPETIRAAQQLPNGKASSSNTTPIEIYKPGGQCLMEIFTTFFQEMQHCGKVPLDFRGPNVLTLYRRRSN